jgi:uncharacterized membrane protein YtjA (UPF0391 family)
MAASVHAAYDLSHQLQGCDAQSRACQSKPQEFTMLHYAIVFFIIALIAALFGFTGIASGAAGIAQILFVVFLVLAIAGFVMNAIRR